MTIWSLLPAKWNRALSNHTCVSLILDGGGLGVGRPRSMLYCRMEVMEGIGTSLFFLKWVKAFLDIIFLNWIAILKSSSFHDLRNHKIKAVKIDQSPQLFKEVIPPKEPMFGCSKITCDVSTVAGRSSLFELEWRRAWGNPVRSLFCLPETREE